MLSGPAGALTRSCGLTFPLQLCPVPLQGRGREGSGRRGVLETVPGSPRLSLWPRTGASTWGKPGWMKSSRLQSRGSGTARHSAPMKAAGAISSGDPMPRSGGAVHHHRVSDAGCHRLPDDCVDHAVLRYIVRFFDGARLRDAELLRAATDTMFTISENKVGPVTSNRAPCFSLRWPRALDPGFRRLNVQVVSILCSTRAVEAATGFQLQGNRALGAAARPLFFASSASHRANSHRPGGGLGW